MLHSLISVSALLLILSNCVSADHPLRIVNKCNIPVTPRVAGSAPGPITKGQVIPPGGADFTTSIPTLSKGLRFWAATDACGTDTANGEKCTLGECTFVPPGTKPPGEPQAPDMRSQCNVSGASGMNGKVTIQLGAQSRSCYGFDDPHCFPKDEICRSGDCLIDDQSLTAEVVLTISDCFDVAVDPPAGLQARSAGPAQRKVRRSTLKRF